jgi:hypothetical protein
VGLSALRLLYELARLEPCVGRKALVKEGALVRGPVLLCVGVARVCVRAPAASRHVR